jgi:Domain of unknown function (DUF4396)
MNIPDWLHTLASISLILAAISALIILIDILNGHPQHMWIMNVVWPLTALYAGPLAVWAYFRTGRLSTHQAMQHAKARGETPQAKKKPFWQSVALSTTHCGSGCTMGDIVAEWFIVLVPLTLFGKTVFAAWVIDYILAFLFGIAFQYFTITPMKGLSPKEGFIAALKADTLSLTSWQIGMYGWMALIIFVIIGHEIEKTNPVFWFMMQIAMLAGFFTSYPVNWWLLRKGIKEKM